MTITTEPSDHTPFTVEQIPAPPTAPKRSRYRDPVFWVLAAVTATSLTLGALAVTAHDDNNDPSHRASDDHTYVIDGYADELDLALMNADVDSSRGLPWGPPIPLSVALGPNVIPARTSLPDSVTMSGDDACYLAGGEILLSKPAQCSVPIRVRGDR